MGGINVAEFQNLIFYISYFESVIDAAWGDFGNMSLSYDTV